MLAMRGGSKDGQQLILLVLEPGNIEKLKEGKPIHKFLNEFMPELRTNVELVFAYSPDLEWVVREIGSNRDMETIGQALEDSLSRPEVLIRGKSAEDMRKVL